MTNCNPNVEELAAGVQNHEVSSIAFVTLVLGGLCRTLEDITGAVDDVRDGPTLEQECFAHRKAYESGRAYYDETTLLPPDPKTVADAVKEELIFMRRKQV